jgi:hypothetical protein
MDETLERLVQFLAALETFNDRLTQSQRELARLRDAVGPHWQDSTRRWHDDLWQPLEETLSHYLNVEAPTYREFLQTKIHALRGYLDG